MSRPVLVIHSHVGLFLNEFLMSQQGFTISCFLNNVWKQGPTKYFGKNNWKVSNGFEYLFTEKKIRGSVN